MFIYNFLYAILCVFLNCTDISYNNLLIFNYCSRFVIFTPYMQKISKDKISYVFCIYNVLEKIGEIYKMSFMSLIVKYISKIEIAYIYIHIHIR